MGEYDQQGRLLFGSKDEMLEQAYRAWLADYLQGKHSVLIAHDQADADEMSRRARGDLKHLERYPGLERCGCETARWPAPATGSWLGRTTRSSRSACPAGR